MKKTISILTILMFLVSLMPLVSAAPPVPKPIRGYFTVNGESLVGYIIEATNGRTEEVISGDTYDMMVTQSGGFAFDLSFFKQGYAEPIEGIYAGDVITVQVKGMTGASTSFNVPTETPYEVTISVTSGQVILYCDDGTPVLDLSNCPVEEEEEPEPELEVETKVISSDDKSSASVEAYLGQVIDISLSDNKVSNLLDKEIKYDGEGYDIHEEVSFKGTVLTSLDDEDYGLNSYLNVLAGDLIYKYIFEDSLPFEDIHAEEPLDIVVLGENYKIIYAEDDLIVLRTGEEYFVKEGEQAGGVEVIAIGENSVSVKVNGVTEIIADGDDRLVNGLNVLVNEILYKSYEDSFVELIVGTEGDEEIKDGDDYADEEDYTWVIDLPNSIGVVNQQDYVSIDDDEEYKAIGVGQGIALPNNYLVFKFKGISESDVIDLTFKVDDGYLNVKGDSNSDTFVLGSEEYDEINVKAEGIYDEDEVLISTDKVRIGDSDTYLELGSVKIGLLTIKLDMSDILYDGISWASEEGNFLDYFGIIFKDAENAVEDQKGFKVLVPEERPEITLTISSEAIVVPPDDVIVTPPDDNLTDDVVVEPPIVEPPVTPPVTPPVEPPIVEPPIEPKDDLGWLYATFIAIIAGILGALENKYHWIKGFTAMWKGKALKANTSEKKRKAIKSGLKAIATVVRKDKEGKYKKKG